MLGAMENRNTLIYLSVWGGRERRVMLDPTTCTFGMPRLLSAKSSMLLQGIHEEGRMHHISHIVHCTLRNVLILGWERERDKESKGNDILTTPPSVEGQQGLITKRHVPLTTP